MKKLARPLPPLDFSRKRLIIYDLDGTIANDEHRKHLIADRKTAEYLKYYALIKNDTPNWPVIEQMVKDHQGGANIVVITGREDTYAIPTLRQLYMFQIAEYINYMIMRPTNNYLPEAEFKEAAISMMVQEGAVVAGIYDDSPSVRKMAASLGIEAFDPATLIEDAKAPKIILPY